MYFINNATANDRKQGERFIFTKTGTDSTRITNKPFIDKNRIGAIATNIYSGGTQNMSLRALKEYQHKTKPVPRRTVGAPDSGTHKFAR
ncbi:MAG: hypothetical protein ACYCZQ_11800 [Burkholderiales bacterium]